MKKGFIEITKRGLVTGKDDDRAARDKVNTIELRKYGQC